MREHVSLDRWWECDRCLDLGTVKWYGGPECWCCGRVLDVSEVPAPWKIRPVLTGGGMVIYRVTLERDECDEVLVGAGA